MGLAMVIRQSLDPSPSNFCRPGQLHCVALSSAMEEKIYAFWLPGNGWLDGASCQCHLTHFALAAVFKVPVAEDLHVVPAWVKKGEIAHHYFGTWGGDGKKGP